MYDNIVKTSPTYQKLGALNNLNDQAYLAAGRQQEGIHYNTLVGARAKPLTVGVRSKVAQASALGSPELTLVQAPGRTITLVCETSGGLRRPN